MINKFHTQPISLILVHTVLAGLALVDCSCQRTSQHGGEPPAAAIDSRGSEAGEVEDGSSGPVDVRSGPHTTNVLHVIKDNGPFILMDMMPEIDRFHSLRPAQQREYLLKRGLLTIIETALERPEFTGHDRFTIKMVLLRDKDEYGRAQWGKAETIANLEAQRSAFVGHESSSIDSLSAEDAAQLFSSSQLTLDPLTAAKEQTQR